MRDKWSVLVITYIVNQSHLSVPTVNVIDFASPNWADAAIKKINLPSLRENFVSIHAIPLY